MGVIALETRSQLLEIYSPKMHMGFFGSDLKQSIAGSKSIRYQAHDQHSSLLLISDLEFRFAQLNLWVGLRGYTILTSRKVRHCFVGPISEQRLLRLL